MELCPCCNALMLRHIRSHQLFWLCQSCSFEIIIQSKNEMIAPEISTREDETMRNVTTSVA
jgi:ribosomal protein L37AE/L43A